MQTAFMFVLAMIMLTMMFFSFNELATGPVRTMLITGFGLMIFFFSIESIDIWRRRMTNLDTDEEKQDLAREVMRDAMKLEHSSQKRLAMRRLMRHNRRG